MRRGWVVLFFVAAWGAGLGAPKRPGRDRAEFTPGVFDYYLLALSWSPQYCASPGGAREALQCGPGKRFGFVVHGLWPQFERGYPADCAAGEPLPPALVEQMLPVMPSPRLIQHEWRKHGTCTGLPPEAYFRLVRRARAAVRIPEEFEAPARQVYVTPDTIVTRFAAANRGLPPAAIRLTCRGRFLSEVRLCMTKDLGFRPCGAGVRDSCRAEAVIMQPLR